MRRECHSAVGAGKRRRMARLFQPDGRAVITAMDHPGFMGAGVPAAAADAIAGAQPDGVLVTWHLARSRAEAFAGAGLVLRVDGGVSELGGHAASDVTSMLYSAEQAMRLGADAVVAMIYPGAPDEEHSLQRLAVLVGECELLGLPVMAESIPGGWGRAVPWTAGNVGRGARIAIELGADIVKTMSPGSPDEMAAVVEACPAPVLALGGPRMDSDDRVVQAAADVVAAGAAGVVFGRNVWNSPDPAGLLGRLLAAVHT